MYKVLLTWNTETVQCTQTQFTLYISWNFIYCFIATSNVQKISIMSSSYSTGLWGPLYNLEKSVLTVPAKKLMGFRQIFYTEFSENLTLLAVNRCSLFFNVIRISWIFCFFKNNKCQNVHPKRFLCSQKLPQKSGPNRFGPFCIIGYKQINKKSSQIYNPLLLFFRFKGSVWKL